MQLPLNLVCKHWGLLGTEWQGEDSDEMSAVTQIPSLWYMYHDIAHICIRGGVRITTLQCLFHHSDKYFKFCRCFCPQTALNVKYTRYFHDGWEETAHIISMFTVTQAANSFSDLINHLISKGLRAANLRNCLCT